MFKKLQKTWKTLNVSFIIDRCHCVDKISAFWCLYWIIITWFKVVFLWWIVIIFFAKCLFISVGFFKSVIIVLTVIVLNIFFHDFIYNSIQKIKTFTHNFSSLFDCCKKKWSVGRIITKSFETFTDQISCSFVFQCSNVVFLVFFKLRSLFLIPVRQQIRKETFFFLLFALLEVSFVQPFASQGLCTKWHKKPDA